MFLYRFLLSQYPHKERPLPTAKDPGSTGELVGAGHISSLDLKSGF